MEWDSSLLNRLGIVDVGYTEEDRPLSFNRYEQWIQEGGHGPLHYLADHRRERRKSLKHYFPPFQSALVFLFSYAEERRALKQFYGSALSNGLKVSSYALGFGGKDYHRVLSERLTILKKELLKQYPQMQMALSLDVHPVLERDLAFRAGLGWFGKNSMLLSKKQGSFFLIGSLLLSQKLPLEKRPLERDHCGQCNLCVQACPTLAIDPQTRTIISHQCISTFTIELFTEEATPPSRMEEGTGEIFGCDLCQDVCPWNERPFRYYHSLTEKKGEHSLFPEGFSSLTQKIAQFFLRRPLKKIVEELGGWSNKKLIREFGETPFRRTGRKALLRNLKFQQQVFRKRERDNLGL